MRSPARHPSQRGGAMPIFVQRSRKERKVSRYVLPDLPYDYGALEPHISGRIMELHHDKHHRKYVDTANEIIEKLLNARKKSDFAGIGALEEKLALNVSGHVLHSIFWRKLAPGAGGQPAGELAQLINRDFGSFDSFKKQLGEPANTVMRSGWAPR